MSAYVISQRVISAIVNAADEQAAKSHSTFSFHCGDDYHTLSRTGTESMTTQRAFNGREYTLFSHSFASLGQLLLDECVQSVQYRYPDDSLEDLPGVIGESRTIYTHNHSARVSVVDALSLIGCYQYQSCEHPGWKGSVAYAFTEALLRALVYEIPGYRPAYEIEESLV